MQTPFLTAVLVHLFSLHFFFLELCWMHRPAVWAKLEHCWYEHLLQSQSPCRWQYLLPCFMCFLWHPSCKQIVFTMINSGVLIMLVVECLEDVVWCGCEETLPLHTKADNQSCERMTKLEPKKFLRIFKNSSVRGCQNWVDANSARNFNPFWQWFTGYRM